MDYNFIYGNALEKLDILLQQNIKADAIITDPPYGTTLCKWDSIIPLCAMWDSIIPILKCDNSPIILFSQQPFTSNLISSNYKDFKYCWYWEKERLTNVSQVKKRAGKTIEEICVFYNKQCVYNPQMQKHYGDKRSNSIKNGKLGKLVDSSEKKVFPYEDNGLRYPTQVLRFKRDILKYNYHPTQKPVKLMEFLIKTYTNEKDTVLDFTCGSGSTGVACRNTNRKFIGIDNGICDRSGKFNNWKWVDVAKWRIENEEV